MDSKKPEYDAGFINFIKINKIELDSECLETFYYNLYYDIPIFINDKILKHIGIQLKIGNPCHTQYSLYDYRGFLQGIQRIDFNNGSSIQLNTLQICYWNFNAADYLKLNNDEYIEFKNIIKQKFNLSYDILKMIYPIILDKQPTNPTLPHILMKQKTFKKFIDIIAMKHPNSHHFLNLYKAMKLYKKHQEKCINNQFIIEESNKKLKKMENMFAEECKNINSIVDENINSMCYQQFKKMEKMENMFDEKCKNIDSKIDRINQQLTTEIEIIQINNILTNDSINNMLDINTKNIESKIDETKEIEFMVDEKTKHVDDEKIKHIINELKIVHNNKKIKEFSNINSTIDEKIKNMFDEEFKKMENVIDYGCDQIEAFEFNIDKKFEALESKINKKIDAIRSEYKDLDSIESKIAEKTKDIEFDEKNVYDNYEKANDEYEKLFESYKQISEHHITINIKNDNIADLFNTVRKNWESHEEKVSKVFSVDYMNNKEFHNAYEERKNAYIIYKDVKLEFQKSTDELNKSNNMQACLYEKLNNADENRKKSYILYKNAISVSEPPPYN